MVNRPLKDFINVYLRKVMRNKGGNAMEFW